MEPALSLLPLKSSNLQTVLIHLGTAKQGKLRSSYNRAIHAQVLEWFRLGQPELAEVIHDSQYSPISLSGLIRRYDHTVQGGNEFYGCSSGKVQEGDEFCFRIGLLNGNLLEPLIRGIEKWKSPSLFLADFPFVIKYVKTLPGGDSLINSSNYELLAQASEAIKPLTLRFLSPTSFKLNQGQHVQPIPLPDSVFGSLLRRWNKFAPEEFWFHPIRWSGLISDFELRSQRLELNNATELGAVGRVSYHFSNPQQAKVATILAHFAFFAGVGRKTAMGMGQVRLEKS